MEQAVKTVTAETGITGESEQTMRISPDGSGVTFLCPNRTSGATYQWYKSTDGSSTSLTAIEGATSQAYKTPSLQKGIWYFYCIKTNSDGSTESTKFSVAYTGLPTISITTNAPITSRTEWQENATLSIMSADTPSWNELGIKMSIKGRGNSSWGQVKKSYSLKFDEKIQLFDFPKAKKWNLIANYSDKSLLRNKFASVLGNEIFDSEWNPSAINVDVVINGTYLGNYTFFEKITITDGRIDIQDISNFTSENIASGNFTDKNNDGSIDLYDGGFILEIDTRKDGEFYFTSSKGVSFVLKDPDIVSYNIQNHVQALVQKAEDALYCETFTDSTEGYQKYLDTDSFVDWYLVNEFAKNNDAIFFTSVYMFYNPNDQKLHMGPNWDFDIGFGNINYNNCDLTTGFWIKNANWISRLFQDEYFVQKVKNKWSEKKSELISHVHYDINSLMAQNQISADYNFMRWQILGTYVWPNAAGYESRTSYKSEIDYLIDWCDKRYQWLDTAINAL